jgi:hypothetical protein
MSALAMSLSAQIENRVLVHLLRRLGEVRVEEQPFPHFFVEEVFPADIYDEMLAALPPTEIYQPMGKRHQNGDGGYNRYEFLLATENFARLTNYQSHVWRGVQRAIGSPQVKLAVYSKLSSGLAYRFQVPREQVSSIAGHPRSGLMRETTGYSIAPHPDTRKKIVTMQFALPVDRSQEALGTALYERSFSPLDWLSAPRGFRKVKQFPFRPNCAYAFSVLNGLGKKSWHGREHFPAALGERNSLLQIYYATAHDAKSYE